METEPIFLEYDEVIELHEQSIAEFGGSMGIRDRGLVESALASAKNAFFFGNGDTFDVAAAYAFHIAEAQAFLDGNKRTAIASAIAFLHLNGVAEVPGDGVLYDAMIAIAKHRLDKPGLADLFRKHDGNSGGRVLREEPPTAYGQTDRRNTKYSLSPGKFWVEGLPPVLNGITGILPLPMILDLTVGEEVVLCWREPTPFADQFASIRPFSLYLNTGMFRSGFGPLMWMVFFVTEGSEQSPHLAAAECLVNPDSEIQLALWRRLSKQTHWHLVILDGRNQVKRFLEFPNNFELSRALGLMAQVCSGSEMTNFERAQEEFSQAFPLETLLKPQSQP